MKGNLKLERTKIVFHNNHFIVLCSSPFGGFNEVLFLNMKDFKRSGAVQQKCITLSNLGGIANIAPSNYDYVGVVGQQKFMLVDPLNNKPKTILDYRACLQTNFVRWRRH